MQRPRLWQLGSILILLVSSLLLASTMVQAALPPPTITKVDPGNGEQGKAVDISILGENFVKGAKVSFSGTGISITSVTFISDSELRVSITIAVGTLRRLAEVSDSRQTMKQGKWLRLVTLDPIYMTKSSVNIEISIERHTAKFVAQWTRELQNRCEAIRDAKVFEKRMVI